MSTCTCTFQCKQAPATGRARPCSWPPAGHLVVLASKPISGTGCMSVLPPPPKTRVCVNLEDEHAQRLVGCCWGKWIGSMSEWPRGQGHWKKNKGHHALVRALVAEGADLSCDLNGHGGTALHKACEEADLALVQILVDGGARIDGRAKISSRFEGGTSQTWTPLHFAVQKGTVSIIECLLAAGAPMAVHTSAASSPYEIALAKGGKGAHMVRRPFSLALRTVARRQALAWGSVLHGRLGDASAGRSLSPDLVQMVTELAPTGGAEVGTADRARALQRRDSHVNVAGWEEPQPAMGLQRAALTARPCISGGAALVDEDIRLLPERRAQPTTTDGGGTAGTGVRGSGRAGGVAGAAATGQPEPEAQSETF
jgi:hypothetical protein